MPSDKDINPINFDFDLPPLPKKLTEEAVAEREKKLEESRGQNNDSVQPDEDAVGFGVRQQPKGMKEISIKPLSSVDILSAPQSKSPVAIPKRNVDTTSEKRITSAASAEGAMESASRALDYIRKSGNTDFEGRMKEADRKADEIFSKKEEVTSDLNSVDVSNIVVDSMSGEGTRAGRPPAPIVPASDEEFPTLDDLSDEHASARRKTRNEMVTRADKASVAAEKKASKEINSEQIYHRKQDFDRSRDLQMKSQLESETRMGKSGQGFLMMLFTAFLTLGCAAFMFLVLGKCSAICLYMTPVMIVAALLLFIRSSAAKNISIVLIAINTLVLLIPGLIFLALGIGGMDGADKNYYTPLFIIALILSCIPMILLSSNDNIYIYYHTDRDGNEI